MGWGEFNSAQNVWYGLPNINSLYTFSTVTVCLYNIYMTGSGEIISGRVADSSGNGISGATITATRNGGGTYTATTNNLGIYALAKIQANSFYTITATKSGYVFPSRSAVTGTSSNFSTTSGNVWAVDFSCQPAITNPIPGSTLTSSSATFNWSGGSGVSRYDNHRQ